ncbi:MAG: Ribosomal protein [Candidatus Kaiserbacteria bacterium]|nr:Ribosomal protein [Candidatus Kaiserbacteria bacterium]
MKLKKGDKVIVIAGKEKGKTSTIVRVLAAENKVVLDGINMVKRARKATRGQAGQIVEIVVPIDASNVMLVDPKTSKPTRIRITRDDKGGRVRVAVGSGQELK